MIIVDDLGLTIVNFGEGSSIDMCKGPLEQLPIGIMFYNGQNQNKGILLGQYATISEVKEIMAKIVNAYLAGQQIFQLPIGKYKSIQEAEEDANNEKTQ